MHIRRAISFLVLIAFLLSCLTPPQGYAQTLTAVGMMPEPGQPVALSSSFTPAQLKGMAIDLKNPFKFDFIIHRGDEKLTDAQKQTEYPKLIKYFLAALAIPDTDQWVNLSPYEKDRIIPDSFGLTEMGRDLLAQDYILKQLAASLTSPEGDLGKKFWDQVYAAAYEKLGTTDIPADTFNKVWIVPDKAVVYEKGNAVYVVESHLKVMLETDYLAISKQEAGSGRREDIETTASTASDLQLPASGQSDLTKQIMREVIIPAIEREVNEGKNFAPLRQVYSGMLLATWYKRALKETILGKLYADQAKVKGVDQDPKNNQQIYDQYVAAFRKGVVNMIKEDVDRYSQEVIPRKYFSGGMLGFEEINFAQADDKQANAALTIQLPDADTVATYFDREAPAGPDSAMLPVTLKNGSSEYDVVVMTSMMSLRALLKKDQVAFNELVKKARDEQYALQSNVAETLKTLALVQADGTIHDSVKNVILSAVEGDGEDMTLGDPVKRVPGDMAMGTVLADWSSYQERINKHSSFLNNGYFVNVTPVDNNTATVEIKVPSVLGREGFVARGTVDFNDESIEKLFKRIKYDVANFGEAYGMPEASVKNNLRELGEKLPERQITESAKQRTLEEIRNDLDREFRSYDSLQLIEKKGGKATAQEFVDAFKAAIEEAQQMPFAKSNDFYAYIDTLSRFTDEGKLKLMAIGFFYNDNGYPMSPSEERLKKKVSLLEEFYTMRGDMAQDSAMSAKSIVKTLSDMVSLSPVRNRERRILEDSLNAVQSGDYVKAWVTLAEAEKIFIRNYNIFGLTRSSALYDELGVKKPEELVEMLAQGRQAEFLEAVETSRRAAAPMKNLFEPINMIQKIRQDLANILEEKGQSLFRPKSAEKVLWEAKDIVRRYGGEPDRYDPWSIEDLESQIQGEYKNTGHALPDKTKEHIRLVMSKLMIKNRKPILNPEAEKEDLQADLAKIKDGGVNSFLASLEKSDESAEEQVVREARDDIDRVLSAPIDSLEKMVPLKEIGDIDQVHEIARLGLAGRDFKGTDESLRRRLETVFAESTLNKMLLMVRAGGGEILMNASGVMLAFIEDDLNDAAMRGEERSESGKLFDQWRSSYLALNWKWRAAIVTLVIVGVTAGISYVHSARTRAILWAESKSKANVASVEKAYLAKDAEILADIARIANERGDRMKKRIKDAEGAGKKTVDDTTSDPLEKARAYETFDRFSSGHALVRLNEVSSDPDQRIGGELPKTWDKRLSGLSSAAKGANHVGELAVALDGLLNELKRQKKFSEEDKQRLAKVREFAPKFFADEIKNDIVLVEGALEGFNGQEIGREDTLFQFNDDKMRLIVHERTYQEREDFRQHSDLLQKLVNAFYADVHPAAKNAREIMDEIDKMISNKHNETLQLVLAAAHTHDMVLDSESDGKGGSRTVTRYVDNSGIYRALAFSYAAAAEGNARTIQKESEILKNQIVKLKDSTTLKGVEGLPSVDIMEALDTSDRGIPAVFDLFFSPLFGIISNISEDHGNDAKSKFAPFKQKIEALETAVANKRDKEKSWVDKVVQEGVDKDKREFLGLSPQLDATSIADKAQGAALSPEPLDLGLIAYNDAQKKQILSLPADGTVDFVYSPNDPAMRAALAQFLGIAATAVPLVVGLFHLMVGIRYKAIIKTLKDSDSSPLDVKLAIAEAHAKVTSLTFAGNRSLGFNKTVSRELIKLVVERVVSGDSTTRVLGHQALFYFYRYSGHSIGVKYAFQSLSKAIQIEERRLQRLNIGTPELVDDQRQLINTLREFQKSMNTAENDSAMKAAKSDAAMLTAANGHYKSQFLRFAPLSKEVKRAFDNEFKTAGLTEQFVQTITGKLSPVQKKYFIRKRSGYAGATSGTLPGPNIFFDEVVITPFKNRQVIEFIDNEFPMDVSNGFFDMDVPSREVVARVVVDRDPNGKIDVNLFNSPAYVFYGVRTAEVKPIVAEIMRALNASQSFSKADEVAKEFAKGGIDFAQSNLDLEIKRDGKGMPLPVSQQNLDNILIDGLVPVILNIRPATSVPLFSEAVTTVPSAA